MCKTIYRVENKQRQGPYRSKCGYFDDDGYYFWEDRSHKPHEYSNRYPSMHIDCNIPIKHRDKYISCFNSLEQLHNWFTRDELNILALRGFFIVRYKYRPNSLKKGTYQCAIKKYHIKPYRRIK